MVIALAVGLPALLLIVLVAVVANAGDDSADPNSVAEQFVTAINDGDADAAEAVLCESGASLLPATVEEIIASEPDAHLVEPLEDHVPGSPGGDLSPLEGSVSEGPAVGQIYVAQLEADGPWCVQSFRFLADPGF